MMKRLFIILVFLLLAVQAWASFVGFGVGVGVGGGHWIDLKPILAISPSSHAFGNVSTASKRTYDFALTNSGNATLTDLSFGTFSSAVFRNATSATSPCGTSLAAKATCNKRVEFGPTAASSYTGTLVILSNQLDNLYAGVTGTGIAAGDSTPDAFSFTDQTDVAVSSTITSAAITVAGIDTTANISVSGGTYDKNASGTFTADAGTVSNGDTVRARHTSSGSNSTAVNTVVTIGGVSDTFTSTTVAASGYTTLFSNNFNCSDTGTITSCSSPDAWNNETDNNGNASITSNQMKAVFKGISYSAYVRETTQKSDVSVAFDYGISAVTGLGNATYNRIVVLSDSSLNRLVYVFIEANSSGNFLRFGLTYQNGSNSAVTNTYNYTMTAGTTVPIELRAKASATTSSADGSVELLINGTSAISLTSINTYNSSFYYTQLGYVYGNVTTDVYNIFDNVVIGYK
jgi:hypothetical protein